jgi:hypothetical protein
MFQVFHPRRLKQTLVVEPKTTGGKNLANKGKYSDPVGWHGAG